MGLFGPKGETTTINVKGMSCNHCKMSVEKALMGLKGVKKATVDLEKANATVMYNPKEVNIDDMKTAIKDAGYEA